MDTSKEYCCDYGEELNERSYGERKHFKNGWRRFWSMDKWGYLMDWRVQGDICPMCGEPGSIGYKEDEKTWDGKKWVKSRVET